MKILIIDRDVPGDSGPQDLLAHFSDSSFTISHVHHLSQAIELLSHEQFDVILADLELPDSHGIKTLQTLRMRVPDVPVVVLTSMTGEALAQQALKEGAQDYLVREEITRRYLFRTLRYAIEHHQLDLSVRRMQEHFELMVADRTNRLGLANEQLTSENEVRKRRERELKRSNRLLRVLTECNQALGHAKNERELLTWICEVLVFTGGFPFVWIGFVDPDHEKKALIPVADAGFDSGSLENTGIILEDTERVSGPGSTAVNTKKAFVLTKIRKNRHFAHLFEEAKRLGYGSAMGIPILKEADQTPGGAIVLLSRSAVAFDNEEKKILSQMAEDLSFGIRALRTRDAHDAAEEALHDSEMFYRTLINTLPVGITVVDTDERIAFLSSKSSEMLHLPAMEEGLGTPFQQWLVPDPKETPARIYRRIQKASGKHLATESNLQRYDGSTFWAELRSSALRDTTEQVIGTLVVTQDITDRRLAEEKIQTAYSELETRVEERTADLYTANLELHKEMTRREQLMAALSDSEQSMRNKQRLLDAAEKIAHIGSWEWDIGSTAFRWSDELYRIFGYEPYSIKPNHKIFTSAIHPDDRERFLAGEKDALAGKKDYDMVFRISRPDGIVRFLHIRGEVTRDDSGRAVGVRGSAQDITERRKAEEELARLATIVAQSDDAIIGMHPDLTVFSWNAGAAKIFGYSATEAAGRIITDLISPKRNTRIRHNLDQTLSGEQVRTFESLCRNRGGSHFYGTLTISPVLDDNGGIFGVILIARDTTDRKRMQGALKESEQKYRSLFETMAQAVLTIDPRGDIIDANPAAEQLFGVSRNQLIGKSALKPELEVVHRDGKPLPEEQYPWIRAFRVGKEVRDIIGIVSRSPPGRRWTIVYATPNYRTGEHAPHQVSVVMNDITDLPIAGA
jgi:PAS domain S-box-containing protein